jgi:hypothetical protein
MEEKQIFKLGDRVEQMCIACNEERGHIIAALSKTGRITRVSCPICDSRVPYRAGGVRRASTKTATPYDRLRTYRKGQLLMHPTFGEGEVTALIEPKKLDVLFPDRIRRLIHSN